MRGEGKYLREWWQAQQKSGVHCERCVCSLEPRQGRETLPKTPCKHPLRSKAAMFTKCRHKRRCCDGQERKTLETLFFLWVRVCSEEWGSCSQRKNCGMQQLVSETHCSLSEERKMFFFLWLLTDLRSRLVASCSCYLILSDETLLEGLRTKPAVPKKKPANVWHFIYHKNEERGRFKQIGPLMTFLQVLDNIKNKKKNTAHVSENVPDGYIMQHNFSGLFIPNDEADISDLVSRV